MIFSIGHAKNAAQEFMAAFHPDRKWWIVGGALRDSERGQCFKDIDIFIQGTENDLLPYDDVAVDLGDCNAYLLRAYTVSAYPYKGETFELNLIFMRGTSWTLESMTDRCDFGICQIGWDPSCNYTYRSDAYLRDTYNGTLTLTRETSKVRLKRMTDKFPFNTFLNPDNLELDGKRRWVYDEDSGSLKVTYDKYDPETILKDK